MNWKVTRAEREREREREREAATRRSSPSSIVSYLCFSTAFPRIILSFLLFMRFRFSHSRNNLAIVDPLRIESRNSLRNSLRSLISARRAVLFVCHQAFPIVCLSLSRDPSSFHETLVIIRNIAFTRDIGCRDIPTTAEGERERGRDLRKIPTKFPRPRPRP